jgi:hypothetical protein
MPDHGGVEPRRVLPYGDRALLVEVADLAAVAAVRGALERAPLPGQCDVVPAARTVLVVLDRRPTDLDVAALRRLDALPPTRRRAGWSCRSSSTGRTSPRSPPWWGGPCRRSWRPSRRWSSPSPSAGSPPASAT